MKSIAIHGRKIKASSVVEVQTLLRQLVSREVQLSVSSDFLKLNEAMLSEFSLAVYGLNQGKKNSMPLLASEEMVRFWKH